MKLSKLLERLTYTLAGAQNTDIEIESIEQDSRKVKENSLFIAIRGTVSDGHDYIPQTIEQGVAAVVCENLPSVQSEKVTYVKVEDCNQALALIASAWNGYPSEQLTLVGVTGTNGKTTIATLLYKLFSKLGYPCGLLSTVCNYVIDRPVEATHTTPGPIELNDLLRQMVEEGCVYAFMEVSSHSVDQKRVGGLDFDGGIFTNLTRDHLDYHKTFDNYLKAKKGFFDMLPKKAFALSNADDRNGEVMMQNTKARKRLYSIRAAADYNAKIIEESFEGMELSLNGTDIVTHFVGRFNASNLVAVYGAALELGAKNEEVLVKMSELVPVNGRFESIRSPKGFSAIVDYAHTPDALINVIGTIREILDARKEGKIITVVGCGGNRDKGKRPIMAKESALRSDRVVLTSDNPRFEVPEEILADMQVGLDTPELKEKCITID
ncbi:MAG: UDP-N-acetylmuramoyl-L-alanyl-D-glutamate--2,6-diaminopimelate ligase, partial [Bacteroidales bacterium]|nr:UDP-N-acetylmuramoyl-L-alanyl-D-glutamate--2,6-diaminopimelate ligase [Bacteroidales bacterium]